MPEFTQFSFAGGQVSERLFGRRDAEGWATWLKRCRNAMVDTEGSVSKRPGTRSVRYAPRLAASGAWTHDSGRVRLVPFKFSASEQYILVLRHRAFDVLRNGEIVAAGVAHPWDGEDLRFDPRDDSSPGLKFSQAGDFLTATHPDYTPRRIVRGDVAGTAWTVEIAGPSSSPPSSSGGLAVEQIRSGTAGGPDYEFSFLAFAMDGSGTPLSPVASAVYPLVDVVVSEGRVAVAAALPADAIRPGDQVRLDDLGGAVELNDRTYAVRSVEVADTGKPQCVTGGWGSGLSEAAAEADALNKLSADYRRSVTYNTQRGSAARNVHETLRASYTVRGLANSDFDPPIPDGLPLLYTADDEGPPGDLSRAKATQATQGALAALRAANPGWTFGTARVRWRLTSWSGGSTTQYGAGDSTWAIQSVGWRSLDTPFWRSQARGCLSGSLSVARTVVGLSPPGPVSAWTSGGSVTVYAARIAAKRDAGLKLSWTPPPDEVDHFAVYQEVDGTYGLAARTPGPAAGVEIQNVAADASSGPPRFSDPFLRDGLPDNPGCSALYQQRRAYGGFSGRPVLKFSRAAAPGRFDHSIPVQDDDAFDRELAATEVDDIRHLLVLGESMLAFTGGGLWRIHAAGPFTPYSATARLEQKHGSSHLEPLAVGRTVLHVDETHDVIRSTRYGFEAEGFVSAPLSALFKDLLRRRRIVSWDVVRGPTSLLLAALDDGRVLCVTVDDAGGLRAAAEWDFGASRICEDVAAANGTDGPAAAFLVREDATDKRELWRMSFATPAHGEGFLADGVVAAESDGQSSVALEDGRWLHWRSGDADHYETLRTGGPATAAVPRGPYEAGYGYETVVETLPVYGTVLDEYDSAHVLVGKAWDAWARADPGGDRVPIADRASQRSDRLPQGSYEVAVRPRTLSRASGVSVEQTTPAPLILLGFHLR